MVTRYYFSPSLLVFFSAALEPRHRVSETWPDDATPVTDEQYQKYRIAGAPQGKQLSANSAGQPVWGDVPTSQSVPAPERRASAINWLDATADRVRASDRSVGQYLDAEYQLVAQALIEYRNHPEGEEPDAIRSYAAAEGLTVKAAAQQIAEAAARVQELLQDVRRIRLAGKAAIRAAVDDADFMETARLYVDKLEALAPPAESDA